MILIFTNHGLQNHNLLSNSNNHYNQIFGSEIKYKKQKPTTTSFGKCNIYKTTKQKSGAQANSKNADKNEQRLLHSLETVSRFRANLNNNEYQEQYFDKNRAKKKDEEEDEEETTPEEFQEQLKKKTIEQSQPSSLWS